MNDCPEIDEIIEISEMLFKVKSSGSHTIHLEVVKQGEIIGKKWETTVTHHNWKGARTVTIVKKSNSRLWGSYRGISLLFISSKFFFVILNRLTLYAEGEFLPETQCGFCSGRGTADMIFAPRQIQEKCIEQNMYMVFIDFTKVFDTVD